MMSERCEFEFDDGAYVLGALAPAERAAYESHLAGCLACRQAVAEIAVLPGLLGRLDPDGLERIAGPSPTVESRLPALLTAAASTRRRQRRTNRWRYAGALLAAVCLALVVGLGAVWLGDRGAPPGTGSPDQMVAMQPVRETIPVTAEIGLHGTGWGTEVTVRCAYPKNGDRTKAYNIRLMAYGPDGETEQVGSWLAAPGDEVTVTGSTRFSGADLVRLELVRYDGSPLLGYNVR
jgi:hypothetical protein